MFEPLNGATLSQPDHTEWTRRPRTDRDEETCHERVQGIAHPDANGRASDAIDLHATTDALPARKRITAVPKGITNLESFQGRFRELAPWLHDPAVWKLPNRRR